MSREGQPVNENKLRAALRDCVILSGADVSDGFPTWPELPDYAVECVKQLRADYDDFTDLKRAEAAESQRDNLKAVLRATAAGFHKAADHHLYVSFEECGHSICSRARQLVENAVKPATGNCPRCGGNVHEVERSRFCICDDCKRLTPTKEIEAELVGQQEPKP